MGLTKKALDYIISCMEEIALKNSHKDRNRESIIIQYHRGLEQELKQIRSNQDEKS